MGPNFPLRKNKNRWEVHYSLTHIQSNWREVLEWCWKTFGKPDKSSWGYHGGWIYFYDENYVTMYSLRWS